MSTISTYTESITHENFVGRLHFFCVHRRKVWPRGIRLSSSIVGIRCLEKQNIHLCKAVMVGTGAFGVGNMQISFCIVDALKHPQQSFLTHFTVNTWQTNTTISLVILPIIETGDRKKKKEKNKHNSIKTPIFIHFYSYKHYIEHIANHNIHLSHTSIIQMARCYVNKQCHIHGIIQNWVILTIRSSLGWLRLSRFQVGGQGDGSMPPS